MQYTGSLFRLTAQQEPHGLAERASRVLGATYERVPNSTHWYHITYVVDESLLPLREPPATSYRYSFLLREGHDTQRFLLLSTHGELVRILLERLGVVGVAETPTVRVQSLVESLTRDSSRYRMTTVFGRILGFGQSIRSLALYGKDLADALLFRMIIPALRPTRVELRELPNSEEAISINAFGGVSFVVRHQSNTLSMVDRALGFLNRRWIAWDEEQLPAHGSIDDSAIDDDPGSDNVPF